MIRTRKLRRLVLRLARGTGRRLFNWLFDRSTVARLTRRTHVLCLGDSNVLILRGIHLPGVWLHRFILGGATASGLENPEEKALSSEQFVPRLARARPWHQVLFMLGGVDCGFVIWYHADRQGRDVQAVLRSSIDAYGERIRETVAMGFRRVLVVSPPLPAMDDAQRPRRRVRGHVAATQLERTTLTLQFNAGLERRCRQLGAVFVDVSSDQLDPETGLIASRFVRPGRDHHLEPGPYRELVARKLAELDW